MSHKPPLVIDTGIVSRYSFSNRFDILEQLYGNNIIIPTDVLKECWKITKMKNALHTALNSGWLEQFTIDIVDDADIVSTFGKLTKRFGPGESAVLSIAKVKGYTVGFDDMRAARKFCQRYNVELKGSIGILYEAYDKAIISESEAEDILNDMIKLSSYQSPTSKFQEAINWFENGHGKQLF